MVTEKERATQAFQAMEELGLGRKFITPILRELLKVYNNEWSYIEAENYRLLADQAFEQQETTVKTDAHPSPRQTRALSASSSAAGKGKRHTGCGDSRSPEKRPLNEAAKPAVGTCKGASKPPLLAKVKIEKEADRTPETSIMLPVVERVETRASHDKHESLRSSRAKLDGSSASDSVPSSTHVTIDAQTLEETLRRVADTSTAHSAETGRTDVNDTNRKVSLIEEKARSSTSKSNEKAVHSLEKVETLTASITQSRVPDSCTTDTTNALAVIKSSAAEPGCTKSRGDGSSVVGQPSCPNVVDEKSRWHKPVNDGANVLLLLADNYSEDEDELNVAEGAVPDPAVVLPCVEELRDEPVLAEACQQDSSVKQLSTDERDQEPVESIEFKLPEEAWPEQPLDMVLSIEEEPEQLDPFEADLVAETLTGSAESIRPRFIVNKEELPVAADEGLIPTSVLIRHELKYTPSTVKRELSNQQGSTQLKRIKYETQPDASSRLPNGCVDLYQVRLDACPEQPEKCITPPCTSQGFLTVAASTTPASARKNSTVADIPGAGANRRKLILSESPSPEASPVPSAQYVSSVADGMSKSTRTDACPTSAEVVGSETAAPATLPIMDNGTISPKSPGTKVSENGASATVVVNTAIEVDDFDDEQQDSGRRLAHLPADISRGAERVPIPYVNDYNSDTIPALYKYIPVNTVFQDAYVNFSLARVGEEDCCGGCLGDCLEAPYPCTCTRETGGVFAYTRDGLLKDEFLQHEVDSLQNEELKEKLVTFCQSGWECPIERAKNNSIPESCKGHLSRKFIKECWHKCGCSMACGNRVVQRGISRQIQIFFTQEGKGWGLRTLEELPPGVFICEYVGEVLTNIELDKRNHAQTGKSKGMHTYPILLDGDWCSEKGLKDEEALCLDATYFGNAARFINHRCFDANLIDMPVTIESPDRHYYHVAFFTSRAVRAMEELTWDYKIDFDDDEHPIEAFKCLCKSPFCRGSSGKKHKKLVKKKFSR